MLGFMQGRLSPIINGRIQSFPWDTWKEEFIIASKHNFKLIEWTLDQDRINENPIMNYNGRKEIEALRQKYLIDIPSLTGDCFMQQPFWKEKNEMRANKLKAQFKYVIHACYLNRIKFIVVPLVDNGRIENSEQEAVLKLFFASIADLLKQTGVKIIFESDYPPAELNYFISSFDENLFGINYDIGNSASLGYNPDLEFSLYGKRILNIHIKDRVLNGGTVPLGQGNAEFDKVTYWVKKIQYSGNFILQTARAVDGEHLTALTEYRKFTIEKLLDE